MKILSGLQGSSQDGAWPMAGTIVGVMHEPVVNGAKSGFFRMVELSPHGLVIHHAGRVGVAVPLEELLALAEAHEPALKPGANTGS